MSRKIFVAGSSYDCGYACWMKHTGITSNIEEADFVLGLGGADISPHYYEQPDSGHLYCSPGTDAKEYMDFQEAIALGKKIVGICKGAQWASVLAGGALFQDIRHPGRHEITTFEGNTLVCNSLHHNLADLSKLKEGEDYRLLAWAENLSNIHINGYGENIPCPKEPEVVYYPKINAMGWQMHPEMLHRSDSCKPFMKWTENLLDKFLSDKV